jgi:predicted nucleic acid-binding protein
LRIYLETSVLVEYCFGRKLDPNKYKFVKALFDKIDSKDITGVVSFYSLHELFIFAIENFSSDISRYIGKTAFEEILKNRVELIPLLSREDRIQYSSSIKLNDSSDIPHAILATIEKCDCIVTYDSHFKAIKMLKILTPDELLEFI